MTLAADTVRSEVPYDQILSQHREMLTAIDDLKTYVGLPRPQEASGKCHEWAQGLARHLLALHEKLSVQFQQEETSGLMGELVTNFPRSSRIVKGLQKEHKRMLREVRSLLPEALRYAEACPESGIGLRRRTHRLLDFLREHETREVGLVEQLYCEDIGTGD